MNNNNNKPANFPQRNTIIDSLKKLMLHQLERCEDWRAECRGDCKSSNKRTDSVWV